MSTIKTILFILQRAPYGSSATREALDTALATAAFEQNVQILFSGDGVFALLPNQQPETISSKDTSKMLQALAYYDIENVYADAVSLADRELTVEHSSIPVTTLSDDALKQLIQSADCVIAL